MKLTVGFFLNAEEMSFCSAVYGVAADERQKKGFDSTLVCSPFFILCVKSLFRCTYNHGACHT